MIRLAGHQTKTPDTPKNLLTAAQRDAKTVSNSLHEYIEVIEAGYEFLLAYAAQGRETDDDNADVRTTLASMSEATAGIVEILSTDDHDFSSVIVDDAKKSIAAISLVMAQDKISSELVDNLNASIHLRALLTDLFLFGETIR